MLTFTFCMDGCITKMVRVVALTFCFLFFNQFFANKYTLAYDTTRAGTCGVVKRQGKERGRMETMHGAEGFRAGP